MAVKVPEVMPPDTVIDDGTVSIVFVLVSVTAAPPVGAGLFSVTVHVAEPLRPKLPGLHDSDDISTDPDRFTVVFAELLLYEAVMVAL